MAAAVPRRRRAIAIVFLVGVTAMVLVVRQHAAATDRQSRGRAVAAYMADLARRTHGGIQLDKSAGTAAYDWDGSRRTLTIPIVVGSCPGVEGSFQLKREHPRKPEDIGDLSIKVFGGAGVSVDSGNLNERLRATDLKPCVVRPIVPPDGA